MAKIWHNSGTQEQIFSLLGESSLSQKGESPKLVTNVLLFCYFTAMKRKFKTKQKQQLSEKTTNILKQKLALQYEFYNYIRAKFDHLKERLGVS